MADTAGSDETSDGKEKLDSGTVGVGEVHHAWIVQVGKASGDPQGSDLMFSQKSSQFKSPVLGVNG